MDLPELARYPELLAAAAIVVIAPASAATSGDFQAPRWLSGPALALFGVLPDRYLARLRRLLVWGNLRESGALAGFSIAKLWAALALLLAALFVNPLVAPGLALAGYLIPDALLLLKVRRRQSQIRRALPQALDLMVMCIDAGLALDATVQRIATEKSGVGDALNEEFGLLARDLLLGTERERAYQALFHRTGVDPLRSLGSALAQSARMGLSISRVLRAQAELLRTTQRLQAEERAMKLPIYMALPMWLCIMPALLIVVLAPSIVTFLGSMGRL